MKHSPLNLRSAFHTQKLGQATRIIDNVNRQKFVTNVDNELELEKKIEAETKSKRLHLASAEPFWQDLNSTVSDICQQKQQASKELNRKRGGPSH